MADAERYAYGSPGGRALSVHLFRPPVAAGERPAVVMHLHGGGWRSGGATDEAPLYLLEHGLAVAAVEYRFSGVARFPAQLIDATAGARWLADHAAALGLDGSRLAVHGVSAGGHLAALLALTASMASRADRRSPFGDPPAVRACVDLYGPTDFNALLGASKRIRHGHARAPEVQLIGGAIEGHPGRVAEANPVGYVHGAAPPTLIVQGGADDFVPPSQSRLLHEALRRAGASSRLVVLPGVGHGGPAFAAPEVRGMVAGFLGARLSGAASARTVDPGR